LNKVTAVAVVTDAQRKANLRLALTLAAVAVSFLVAFVVKVWSMGPG
jgi:hypothetical protein